MLHRRAAALLVLTVAACGDDPSPANPTELTDQSGAVFGWDCDDERCALTRLDESPEAPDCGPILTPGYSYSWGHFMEITAVCADDEPGWVALPGWGRLVVCETDADCPTIIPSQDEYVCNAGFCKDIAAAEHFDTLPNRDQMTAICLGHLPRFELDPFTPSPELQAAIDEACPDEGNTPCLTVPAGCPDPRG